LDDDVVDMIGGRFDMALRIAALADSSLRARRLCEVRRLLVGAPAYLDAHGRPEHPDDLAAHACFEYAYLPTSNRWRFSHRSGEIVSVTPTGPLRANNADVFRAALLAGIGLAVQPEFLVWDDVAAGRLEPLMTQWSLPHIALNIVLPPGRLRAAPVSAVVDFLSERFAAAPWAMPGGAGADLSPPEWFGSPSTA
jgi:DNA-binding transcriptional LysR family regulator